jgi:hypothetical protein
MSKKLLVIFLSITIIFCSKDKVSHPINGVWYANKRVVWERYLSTYFLRKDTTQLTPGGYIDFRKDGRLYIKTFPPFDTARYVYDTVNYSIQDTVITFTKNNHKYTQGISKLTAE